MCRATRYSRHHPGSPSKCTHPSPESLGSRLAAASGSNLRPCQLVSGVATRARALWYVLTTDSHQVAKALELQLQYQFFQ